MGAGVLNESIRFGGEGTGHGALGFGHKKRRPRTFSFWVWWSGVIKICSVSY